MGRCLFFANRGEFRSGDAEEIMNKASSLSLLSNAVLVWNTLRISEILNQTAGGGPHDCQSRPCSCIAAHAHARDPERYLPFLG